MLTSSVLDVAACEEEDLVDMAELRLMLGRASRRGETVARSYAHSVSRDRTFPAPVIDRPRVRLWRRTDVEHWLDEHRPAWRGEESPGTGGG
jgi:hypothetical protein